MQSMSDDEWLYLFITTATMLQSVHGFYNLGAVPPYKVIKNN